ncbi:MAG: alpha/beta hydrolase [Saprospirales bacterium]|nr:alpha/beta hydrolase [Saprospirales bacterium]MBK6901644.1 alpha/beta hydrolase [Saprospirales bacterium]
MPEITFQSQKIYYTVSGAGSALVFIHGFGVDSRFWDAFVSRFQKSHQVICIDMPGAGKSGAISGLTVEGMAQVVRAVVEELHLPGFVLTGHSMGGYVALAYAEKWPESVHALCMFHSQPYPDSEEKKAARLKSMDFVRTNGAAPLVSQLVPALFTPAFVRDNPSLIQQLIGWASAYPVEGVVNALDAMRQRPDRSEVLRNAKYPVLFLIGAEDGAIPAEASKQQTTLPSVSSIHYLEGVAHMGMLEATEKTQGIFSEFLNEIS